MPDDARHVFVRGDIGDRALVARCCASTGPRAIVHFAAESHVDRSIDGPGRVRPDQRRRHLRAARGGARVLGGAAGGGARPFRFLHVSTDEVYGSLGADGPAFTETTPYAPNSPYSASKAAADHLVRAYHHTYGLPTLTTNCSNNYGPYQFPEKLIPLMILNALAGKPLPVYGDGQNVRDWLYVDDHCAAIRAVLERGRAGRDLQHRRQQREAEPRGGADALRRCSTKLRRQRRDYACADHLRQGPRRATTGATPSTAARSSASSAGAPAETFETGMRRTVAWYLDNAGLGAAP